jgi:hypothetical protein
MKRLLILLFVVGVLPAQAQSLTDLLKKVASDTATEVIDQVTGGKLTEVALVGTWNYSQPAVRLESDKVLSSLSGSAFETPLATRMEKAYNFVGIKPGVASFTFNQDKTFKAVLGKKTLEGTYVFDAENHTIALTFSSKMLGTMNGRVFLDGKELQLVFPVTKLVQLIKSVGSSITYLQSVVKVLENYDEVYLGFGFTK